MDKPTKTLTVTTGRTTLAHAGKDSLELHGGSDIAIAADLLAFAERSECTEIVFGNEPTPALVQILRDGGLDVKVPEKAAASEKVAPKPPAS